MRQIQPAPEIVNDVVLYDVLIDVKNEGRRLMTGMTTQVFFVLGKAENVTIIPVEALTRRAAQEDNDKGKAYRVFVATDSGRQERVIHIGLQTRTQAQATDGLNEGERILVPSPDGAATPQTNAARNNAARFNRGPQL